jgi:hypothetical protein
MSYSRLGCLLLLAAGCRGGDARRHAARRWDTSQDHFQLKSAAVIAVASARYWPGGIEGDYIRSFLDEFDIVADSLEARQYEVGVSFRDSIRVQQGTANFDLRPRSSVVPNDGYYFLAPGEPPRFVSGPRRHGELLHAIRLWEETRSRAHEVVTPSQGGESAHAIPAADTADHTVFLPLDSFPAVPLAVRTAFQHRGCRIPQAYYSGRPNNVVPGHFRRKQQRDWAAFCATGDRVMVVVAWGGPSDCPDSLVRTRMPVAHADQYGLAVADPETIQRHELSYGAGDTLSLDHDGIDLGIDEKASETYYCEGGLWVPYVGAD